jgi:hypothetical protein
MYCPSCGETIPAKSKYCMSCGKLILAENKAQFSDLEPKHMVEVGWREDIPTEKNWLGKIYTGFRFWFSLIDETSQPTWSDGILEIKMSEMYIGILLNTTYATKFEKTYKVTKSDFSQSNIDPNFFGFICIIDEAVLNKEKIHRIELWFKTPDGRIIYGTDRS